MSEKRFRAMSRSRLGCIAALGLLATTSVNQASEGPPPVRHITTYRSPSGEYALTVDPTRLHGGGPCKCRVERDNKLVWEKQIEFTFWEAAITNEGLVAGYGYTAGWRGFDDDRKEGDFVVAILGADGSTRFNDHRARAYTGAMHSPPEPTARGCFLDQLNKRFVVRFSPTSSNEQSERWEVYDLANAKRIETAKLASPGKSGDHNDVGYPIQVLPIPDSGLVLIAWCRTRWTPRQDRLRLSLVESDAHEIWNLERPDEFKGIEDLRPWECSVVELAPPGATTGFVFKSIADQARITFSVTRNSGGAKEWRVRESKRVSEQVSIGKIEDEDGPPLLETISLVPRGFITLRSPDDSGEKALDILDFDFDDHGNFGVVPRNDDQTPTFVLYSQLGRIEKSIPLNSIKLANSDMPQVICVGLNKWIVFTRCSEKDSKVQAFRIDVAGSNVARLSAFDAPCQFLKELKGTDGRFAILDPMAMEKLAVFDDEGRKLWSIADPVFSSRDIAFNSRGELAVLGGIRNALAVYDKNGRLIRTIDLDKSTGRTLSFVTGLESDAHDGWILHDFAGEPSILRLKADGTVFASLEPRFDDGRQFRLCGNVKRLPDGRLWTSDGSAILRLTDRGIVDQIIGRKPDSAALDRIRCATIDTNGNFYCVAEHNAFVHVFDSNGKLRRVLKPLPTDFARDVGLGAITVAGDGTICYRPTDCAGPGADQYLKFNADGTRDGFEKTLFTEVSEYWYFRPGSQDRLVIGYERAWLVPAGGKPSRMIERRADGRWLEHPDHAAFAPDGSFVILAEPSNMFRNDQSSVTYYNPVGDPMKTFDLPVNGYLKCATNGKTIIVFDGTTALVIDITTGKIGRWSPFPNAEKTWIHPFTSPDGKEVWCLDSPNKTVHKFAMP